MFHPGFSPGPVQRRRDHNQAYNDQPIGNGPFAMDSPWSHDRGIRLIRNYDYGLDAKANLDAVEMTIGVDSTPDLYNGFPVGKADWTPVLPADLDSLRDQPGLRLIFSRPAGTSYLMPMVTTKPLDVAAARRAISLAIDRDAIIRACSMTDPRGRQPGPTADGHGSRAELDACRFDPVEARRLAARAGLTAGTALHFRYNDDGPHEAWSVAVKRQLETNLGIEVNYYGLPFAKQRLEERAPGTSGISRVGYTLDYPSPDSILSQLTTFAIGTTDPAEPVSGDNLGRYHNPRFDRLLDRARATVERPPGSSSTGRRRPSPSVRTSR